MNKSSKKNAVIFINAGIGDNLLTLPLLFELETELNCTLAVIRKSEYDFFKKMFPNCRVVMIDTLRKSLRLLISAFFFEYWIYPIGSCIRRHRLLHLLAPFSRAVGFTSLASEKTWQAEIGFKFTLLPDLGRRAWKNNLRLLPLIFENRLNETYSWRKYQDKAIAKIHSLGPIESNRNLCNNTLAIHPGSNLYFGGLEKYKRWPIQKYFDLARKLEHDYTRIYWIVGPGEEGMLDLLSSFCKSNPEKHEIINTGQAFGNSFLLLLKFLDSVSHFLGNDSGIAHLCSFTRTPMTIVVGGMGQVTYTGQEGQNTELLWKDIECRACTIGIPKSLAMNFFCPNNIACLEDITVENVLSAVKRYSKKGVLDEFNSSF